jgi:ribulose-bisphosphate carboxylase large chain
MTSERIEADYLIETSHSPESASNIIAGEQSSGTFLPIPGETPELKARSAATVDRMEVVGEVSSPSLPGSSSPTDNGARRIQVKITLSWPFANFGPSLPNLLATVAGNLFELKQLSGARILDIRLPQPFAKAYEGPQFGIEGTRQLAGVYARPILGTIIKPSVGFGPTETAGLVKTLVEAGIDFIKDDELQSDGSHCPFDRRVRSVMAVINREADRTGKKAMYAFNLTGDLDQMRRRHDLVEGLGGTCVMASLNSIGLVGMIELRRHARLPIHAHRNGWGFLTRHPALGWSYIAWQKIWRLAGADHMHVNGLRNKFSEADDSVIASARECLRPMFANKPCIAMPVFSSGQTARQAPDTFRHLGSVDLIHLAGGGIMAHPHGPAAGLMSLRESWEAAMSNIPLDVHARSHTSLAAALETFA